jgi:hypothetical protein
VRISSQFGARGWFRTARQGQDSGRRLGEGCFPFQVSVATNLPRVPIQARYSSFFLSHCQVSFFCVKFSTAMSYMIREWSPYHVTDRVMARPCLSSSSQRLHRRVRPLRPAHRSVVSLSTVGPCCHLTSPAAPLASITASVFSRLDSDTRLRS